MRILNNYISDLTILSKKNEHYTPNVINTQMDGIDGYATSDLLSPHPTKPRFWKVVGRTDDQIMHSTGEKTNPGPLGMLELYHDLLLLTVGIPYLCLL